MIAASGGDSRASGAIAKSGGQRIVGRAGDSMKVTRGRLAWVQRRPHKPHHEGSTPSRATTLRGELLRLIVCLLALAAWAMVATLAVEP